MLYILKFDRPLGTMGKGCARYYLGYCEDGRLQDRYREHLAGKGAAITRAANERGIGYVIVAMHSGDRNDERRYKRWHNNARLVEMWTKGIR